ncbi:MAG: hypothetical protein PHH21_02530, partial [Candidatus Pacebacteria bacterium]|nr:hypothetical protein [Candidatus Paceibacterota bacterium]
FSPFLVFGASFLNKKSYWRLERFDYICGLLSIMALVAWGLTKDPNMAIILAIASDGLAATPTLIKFWKYPKTETVEAYASGLINAATSFFAIKIWSFSSFAFPIYLVTINTGFVICYLRGKFKKS